MRGNGAQEYAKPAVPPEDMAGECDQEFTHVHVLWLVLRDSDAHGGVLFRLSLPRLEGTYLVVEPRPPQLVLLSMGNHPGATVIGRQNLTRRLLAVLDFA